MSILTNGYCSDCGQYTGGATHICRYSATPVVLVSAHVPAPSAASSNSVEQLLVALQEITRLLREIEYHVRPR